MRATATGAARGEEVVAGACERPKRFNQLGRLEEVEEGNGGGAAGVEAALVGAADPSAPVRRAISAGVEAFREASEGLAPFAVLGLLVADEIVRNEPETELDRPCRPCEGRRAIGVFDLPSEASSCARLRRTSRAVKRPRSVSASSSADSLRERTVASEDESVETDSRRLLSDVSSDEVLD